MFTQAQRPRRNNLKANKNGGHEMSGNVKREQRRYTDDYKAEAVKLARQFER